MSSLQTRSRLTSLRVWREREPVWATPVFPYLGWILLGWTLTLLAVEFQFLQRILLTESLTGAQWALCIGLSAISPGVIWIDKTIQIRKLDRSSHPALATTA